MIRCQSCGIESKPGKGGPDSGVLLIRVLGSSQLLAIAPHHFDVLLHRFVTGGGCGKPLHHFRSLVEEGGVTLANGIEDGRKFGQQEETLVIAIDEEFGLDRAMKHKGGGHLPIADHLAKERIVRVGGI